MKSSYAVLVLAPFLIACDPATDHHADRVDPGYVRKISDTSAAYATNPYDSAGVIHNQMLTAYNVADTLPQTMSGVITRVELVGGQNMAFSALKNVSYAAITASEAAAILYDSTAVETAIDAASLGSVATSDLEEFTTDFLQLCRDEDDYGLIYDYITGFEDRILAKSTLSTAEKKFILTVTSIVRHSQFKRKRPKKNRDLDWEHNVFHLAGAISGSSSGTAQAISRSLTLGIAENR